MEHLDHLLGTDRERQFHGGDYLSAESSSSISSIESSRPRRTVAVTTKEKADDDGADRDPSTTPAAAVTPSRGEPRERKSPRKSRDNVTGPALPQVTQSCTQDNGLENQKDTCDTQQPLWSLEPRIFALEKTQGKRKYLVGQFGRVADWYWRKSLPSQRHLYEVIREDTPCRLYFDLEYSKEHNNRNREGGAGELVENTPQLLREFLAELAADLKTYYGLALEMSQIINLDSSNDKKFSRHWIIHLMERKEKQEEESSINFSSESSSAPTPFKNLEVLFRDAPTVGRFVKRLVSRLAEEIAVEGDDFSQRRPMLSKYLFVNTKDANKPTCFVDLGVYTRNRLFRCLGSSKFGKTATLQAMLKEDDEAAEDETYYPLSLPAGKRLDPTQSADPMSLKEFVIANDWEPHALALAESLVVPLRKWPRSEEDENDKFSTRVLDVEDESFGGVTAGNLLTTAKRYSSIQSTGGRSNRSAAAISMARQGSPLPSLDKYVTDVLAARGGTQGSIRAWSVEYGPKNVPVSITYHMQKNRYCELIGRSHKSNNIFWTVDLTSWICIQGCHDPECFGRGSPVPVPNDEGRLDKIQKEFEAWQEEEFEKALMALNIDDIVAEATARQSESTTNQKDGDNDDVPDEGALSDKALMQAIGDNPELFP